MHRHLFVAALAASLSFGAQAKAVTLSDTNPGADAAFSYTGTNLGKTFSDTLNFTLGGSTQWGASGSAEGNFFGVNIDTRFFHLVVGQGLETLKVSIFGSNYSEAIGSFVVGLDTLTVTIPKTVVAAGNYSAVVSGTTRDTFLIPGKPSYSFSLVAQPVPEPETYAMMMAGLGLIGFIARRRTKNTAI